MQLTHVLDACASLTFAQIQVVHQTEENCFAIAHKVDPFTLKTCVPTQSYFLNKNTLQKRYQFYRVGPFYTPFDVSLEKVGLPSVNDFILGQTGSNAKGAIFTSWLPHMWACPILYFFYYLKNVTITRKLYEHHEETTRILLLHNLSVQYQSVWDERLYDMLLLLLFDNYTHLIHLSTIPKHRPPLSRKWTLDKKAIAKIQKDAKRYTSLLKTCEIHVPSVFEFVDEVAFFVREPNILRHFRSLLSEVPNTIQIPEHSLDYKTMKQLVSKTSI